MITTVNLNREDQIKRIHNTAMLAMRIHKRWFVQRLQEFGLTFPQFITLAALSTRKQACTMSDLTNITFQDPPTTTGVINRLVKMNLVQRTRSKTDRRVVLAEPTQTGLDLVEEIKALFYEEAMHSYGQLSNEQLTAFEQLLDHFVRTYLKQYLAAGTDIDAELQKLEHLLQTAPNCIS